MSDRLREARAACEDARRSRERRPSSLFERESWEDPASASAAWRDHALDVVRTVATGRPSLTIEDVAPRVEATSDRRALGAVMRAAARKGWIVSEGWAASGAERHGRPVRQWRSRLWAQPQ